ncbi:hypothetical protein G9A89_015004 [Geosiphon pyriformis]|nr:hypothetical protein G9A89_015004 [Geosiphon pyriformis]
MDKLFWDMVEDFPESSDEEGLLEPPKGSVDSSYNQKRLDFLKNKQQKQLRQQVKRHTNEITEFLRETRTMVDTEYVQRQTSIRDPIKSTYFEQAVTKMLTNEIEQAPSNVSNNFGRPLNGSSESDEWTELKSVAKYMVETPGHDQSSIGFNDIEDVVKMQYAELRRKQRAEQMILREHQIAEMNKLGATIRKRSQSASGFHEAYHRPHDGMTIDRHSNSVNVMFGEINPLIPNSHYQMSNHAPPYSNSASGSVANTLNTNSNSRVGTMGNSEFLTQMDSLMAGGSDPNMISNNAAIMTILTPEQQGWIFEMIRTMAVANNIQQQQQNSVIPSRDPRITARSGINNINNGEGGATSNASYYNKRDS